MVNLKILGADLIFTIEPGHVKVSLCFENPRQFRDMFSTYSQYWRPISPISSKVAFFLVVRFLELNFEKGTGLHTAGNSLLGTGVFNSDGKFLSLSFFH